METFITENVQPGVHIAVDSWRSYSPILKEQYLHVPTNQSKAGEDYDILCGVHLVASLIKLLVRRTFQGRFEPKYMQNQLDEGDRQL